MLLFCLLLSVSEVCFSAGLSSTTAEIYLSNLKIGQQYSIKQFTGKPFYCKYDGRASVDININIKNSDRIDTAGFEPLPDLSWIRLVRSRFAVDPGEQVQTDIIVSIPADENLCGKKFKCYIVPETTSPEGIPSGIVLLVGITCVLKLEISPYNTKHNSNVVYDMGNIAISQERFFIPKVPLNKRIYFNKHINKTLKISNQTNYPVHIFIDNILPATIGIKPPDGYEEATETRFLTVGKKKLILRQGATKEIPLSIKLPQKQKYKNKKLYFLLHIRATPHTISKPVTSPETYYNIKIYVDTTG